MCRSLCVAGISKLAIIGQLFSVAYGVVPGLIRSEKKNLLKSESTSNLALIRPHPPEVKYITEWSGLDVPLFNPSCIVNTPGAKEGDGLCITRYGGRCFQPEKKRKPSTVQNGRYRFVYGLANYTFGAVGRQISFSNLVIPENLAYCDNDGHPRWFYFNRELYVISWSEGCDLKHVMVPLSRQQTWSNNEFSNWIWKFGTNETSWLSWDGYICQDNKDEFTRRTAKNFLPFQHKEKLMAIVQTTPHLVYEIDPSNGNMKRFAETPGKLQFDQDVGLSAGPVAIDDQRLLVAAHVRSSGRRMFFYTCEAFPPFSILEETPLFFFTGESPERVKRKAFFINFGKSKDPTQADHALDVEYGVQMQIVGEELMLSMGLDDCDAAVVTVPLSNVTAYLRPLHKSVEGRI